MKGDPDKGDPDKGGPEEPLEIDVEVDALGLTCPMPLLKAKRALNAMATGQHLQVLATDPGSVRDFEVFSEQSGHRLLSSTREGDRFVHVLCKSEPRI